MGCLKYLRTLTITAVLCSQIFNTSSHAQVSQDVSFVSNSVNTSTLRRASKTLHAYVLQAVNVIDRQGTKIGTIAKGTTFQYKGVTGGFAKLNYYGKAGYVSSNQLILDSSLTSFVRNHKELFGSQLTVKGKAKIFKRADKTSKVIRSVRNCKFQNFGLRDGFYKVQLDGKFGYVDASICSMNYFVDVTVFPKLSGSTKGEKIVSYARKFLGNPYVWGGTSLTNGCDCSGYVQGVYKAFGYTLPRCSYQQATVGKKVKRKDLQPGDLLFYDHGTGTIRHVKIYAGNGKCVEAKGAAYGIVEWDLNDGEAPDIIRRII